MYVLQKMKYILHFQCRDPVPYGCIGIDAVGGFMSASCTAVIDAYRLEFWIELANGYVIMEKLLIFLYFLWILGMFF